MSLSFKGFENAALTLAVKEKIPAGTVVALSGSGEVAPALAYDCPFGVVMNSDDEYACVLVKGVAEMPCDSSVFAGYMQLETNENGQIIESSDGVAKFVISVDEDKGSALVLL